MKNYRLFRKLGIGFAFIALLFTGCVDYDGLIEKIQGNIDLNLFRTSFNITAKDAFSGDYLGLDNNSESVELFLKGPTSESLVDSRGKVIDKANITGAGSFYLNPLIMPPTANKPIRVVIEAYKNGYLSDVKTFDITDKGPKKAVFEMINMDNPPNNVKIDAMNSIAQANNGVIGKDIDLLSNEDIRLKIAQGAKFVDRDGKALNGELSIKSIFFNSSGTNGKNFIPKGVAHKAFSKDGIESRIPLGKTAQKIIITDQNGIPAKGLSDPNTKIQFGMFLDPSTINPETGKQIAAGDKVPVWIFDQETATWVKTTTVTVQKTAPAQQGFSSKWISYLYAISDENAKAGWFWEEEGRFIYMFDKVSFAAWNTESYCESTIYLDPGNDNSDGQMNFMYSIDLDTYMYILDFPYTTSYGGSSYFWPSATGITDNIFDDGIFYLDCGDFTLPDVSSNFKKISIQLTCTDRDLVISGKNIFDFLAIVRDPTTRETQDFLVQNGVVYIPEKFLDGNTYELQAKLMEGDMNTGWISFSSADFEWDGTSYILAFEMDCSFFDI